MHVPLSLGAASKRWAHEASIALIDREAKRIGRPKDLRVFKLGNTLIKRIFLNPARPASDFVA